MEGLPSHALEGSFGKASSPSLASMTQNMAASDNGSNFSALSEKIRLLWMEKVGDFDTMSDSEVKLNRLPIARIKLIMKTLAEVGKNMLVSAEVPLLLAKACEMLILHLTSFAWEQTSLNRRRTLQHGDLIAAIDKAEIFHFLLGNNSTEVLGSSSEITQSLSSSSNAHSLFPKPNDMYYMHPSIPSCSMMLQSSPMLSTISQPYEMLNPYFSPVVHQQRHTSAPLNQLHVPHSPRMAHSSVPHRIFNAYTQQPDGSLRCLPMQHPMMGRNAMNTTSPLLNPAGFDPPNVGLSHGMHSYSASSNAFVNTGENSGEKDVVAGMTHAGTSASNPYDFRYQLSNGR